MLIGEGCYRKVYSIGKNYVCKIPKSLWGLRCNVVETFRYLKYRETRHKLCPIVLPFFVIVIMHKAEILGELYWESYYNEIIRKEFLFSDNNLLNEDVNESNMGLYRNKLVLVDYGGYNKKE